jgi:hypothetical protein
MYNQFHEPDVAKLVIKFPMFYGTRRFTSCLQEPATDPCPELHEFGSPPRTLFPEDPF